MKKIIYFCTLIFLSIIIVLNLIFTANLDLSEHITIEFNSFLYIIGMIILGISLYIINKTVNDKLYEDIEKRKKLEKYYLLVQLLVMLYST